jgi:hypothetical protein
MLDPSMAEGSNREHTERHGGEKSSKCVQTGEPDILVRTLSPLVKANYTAKGESFVPDKPRVCLRTSAWQ